MSQQLSAPGFWRDLSHGRSVIPNRRCRGPRHQPAHGHTLSPCPAGSLNGSDPLPWTASTPALGPALPGQSLPIPQAWASRLSPHHLTGSLRGRQPPPPAGHPDTQPSLQPVSRRIASSHVGNLAWMTPLSAETPGPAASNQGLWSPRGAPAHASHPTRGDFLSPRACPTL